MYKLQKTHFYKLPNFIKDQNILKTHTHTRYFHHFNKLVIGLLFYDYYYNNCSVAKLIKW